jgi:hypothetical protein
MPKVRLNNVTREAALAALFNQEMRRMLKKDNE